MRRFLFLAVSICLWGCSAEQEKPPYNVLFILADDLGYHDLSCMGSTYYETPNIDRIANEGIRFNRCFQAAPMCSPTRHNLYTGLYPVKSGAYPNHARARKGVKSIAHYLQAEGYRVGLTGKTQWKRT